MPREIKRATETQTLHDPSYMWNLRQSNPWAQTVLSCLGLGGGGNGEFGIKWHRVSGKQGEF